MDRSFMAAATPAGGLKARQRHHNIQLGMYCMIFFKYIDIDMKCIKKISNLNANMP